MVSYHISEIKDAKVLSLLYVSLIFNVLQCKPFLSNDITNLCCCFI